MVNWAWAALALALWLVALVLVRGERLQRLLPVGLVGGFGLALVIQLVAVPVLGLWSFRGVLVPLAGIPLFLLLAYMAEAMIFAHLLPQGGGAIWLYVLAFAAANVVVEYFYLRNGLRVYGNWNLFYSFVLGVASHWVIVYVYRLMLHQGAVTS